MNFLIINDPWKPETEKLARDMGRYLWSRGVHSYRHEGVVRPNMGHNNSTIAIILGGDGFIVQNTLPLAQVKIPLLGINFGTVGFLAPVEPEDWREAFEKVLSGQYKTKRTRLLKGVLKSKGGGTEKFEAVNDVALVRGLQKLVRVRVKKDGVVLHANIGGDGVIITSAIGSTAYSFAAGGTVFERGIGFTPHATHRADVKPLIFERGTFTITCLGGSPELIEDFSLEIDGHGVFGEPGHTIIHPGDQVLVWLSKLGIKRVEPEGFSIISALQKKLGLSR